MVLEASDELRHPHDPDDFFWRESVYFNFADAANGLGGWIYLWGGAEQAAEDRHVGQRLQGRDAELELDGRGDERARARPPWRGRELGVLREARHPGADRRRLRRRGGARVAAAPEVAAAAVRDRFHRRRRDAAPAHRGFSTPTVGLLRRCAPHAHVGRDEPLPPQLRVARGELVLGGRRMRSRPPGTATTRGAPGTRWSTWNAHVQDVVLPDTGRNAFDLGHPPNNGLCFGFINVDGELAAIEHVESSARFDEDGVQYDLTLTVRDTAGREVFRNDGPDVPRSGTASWAACGATRASARTRSPGGDRARA